MTRINPIKIVTDAAYAIGTIPVRFIGFVARYLKESDGLQNVAKTGMAVIEFMKAKGIPTDAYSGLNDGLKMFSDNLRIFKFTSTANELLSGEAWRKNRYGDFPNITRLASRMFTACSDIIVVCKQAEKVALSAAGTTNALVGKVAGTTLDAIEPFIGFSGVGLDLLDTSFTIWNHGITSEAVFTTAGDVARLVGIVAKGTVIGASFSLGGCALNFTKYIYNNYGRL